MGMGMGMMAKDRRRGRVLVGVGLEGFSEGCVEESWSMNHRLDGGLWCSFA